MDTNKKPYTSPPLSHACLTGAREAIERAPHVVEDAISRTKASLGALREGQVEHDLLYGVKGIAAHLRLTPRQTAHLIGKGHLPTFRLGAIICATKTGLAEHFVGLQTFLGSTKTS